MFDSELGFLPYTPSSSIDVLKRNIAEHGYGFLDYYRDISDYEFIGVMSIFGKPIPEKDEHALRHASSSFVLHLHAQKNIEKSVYLEPFSTDALGVHIERAFSLSQEQPNYLGLFCKEIGELLSGNTIVLSMKEVFYHFNDEEKNVLRKIFPISQKYDINSSQPIIAYDVQRNIEFFSFRDLGELGIDWDYVSQDENLDIKYVNLTIQKLLKIIRNVKYFSKIPWIPGRLLVFDNKLFFHARTKNLATSSRYLKRIRII